MKQLLRNENHRSYNCLIRKMLLAIVIVQFLLLSGFALDQANAAGGDLKRPAASDSPQPGKQEAKASVVDRKGNLIITGYQNLAGATDDDYLTVKFNSDGSIAWRKSYNRSGGSDQATAIALDSKNNVIVTGFSWNGNNYDIYTVKYRSDDGTKIWEHTYNAPANGNDIATSIAIDTLDCVYVGGYVQTTSANEDYVILKYGVDGPTPEGAPFWVATWNGDANGTDKLSSIATGANGVAVTGQSWNGADFDVMTVKYDYSGTKLWEKRYTSSGQYPDVGRKVAIDGSGNVIMTAAVTNSGNLDIYTAKYPSDGGDPIWENTYNNPINNDEPFGLILDSSGNVYVTGYTFTLSGNEDLLVVRYKGSDGAKEWEKVYDSGSSSSDSGIDLLLDEAGNLLVTGNSVTTGGNSNIITLKIKNDSSNPALYWAATYDGAAGKNEKSVGIGIGLGSDGEVVIGGWTDTWTSGATDYDYLMLAYDPGLLNPPSGLLATVLSNTSVKIDWTDNSTNEDGFRIERKLTEMGPWVEAGTVGPNISTFTDTGIVPSSTYYYRVRSYNSANGSSNPSEEIRVLTLYVTYIAPVWSYRYNGLDNFDDFPAGIAVGPDNNPVVTGYSLLNTSGFDYFTIKLNNSDGSLLWSDRYNDADDQLDRATSVAVDSTNAAIVTGYSSLYYAPVGDNINSIYTTKYPASCSPPTPCTPATLWHGQYNGQGGIDDRATAVATSVDADNSVVVTGYGKNASGNEDIYLIKYAAIPALDDFGKAIPEWSATPYNSTFNRDDFPAGLAFDNEGNVFVTGRVQSSSAPVKYKSFVAKYCGKAGAPCNGKAPGEIIWEDSFTGSGDNHARSLAVDKDGNLYVAGFDTGSNGRDILLIKYDSKAVPTGSRVLWSKTLDGAAHGDDEAVSVKYDQIDDTVVVGGTVLTAGNDHDLIVIRYDSAGNEKWRKIILRPGTDEVASDMAMDVSGNVSIAGYTSNGPTSDAISVEYDYAGTLLAATIYNGEANSYDEATAVIFNSLGDTLVAGYSTNASGNADYLVYKRNGLPLQASSPFTATQYYTKVDLVWTDTSTGETGFYVERKTGDCDSENEFALIYTAAANATTYSDTGLNAGQEYCYRVRSFKEGEIDPRWIERYALLDKPVPPGNVIATAINTTRIDLTWQDNTTGETGFRIFRCAGAACSDFNPIDAVAANVVTYSDTTVAKGTPYSYKIISYKTADWESDYSTPAATATTPSPVAPVLTAIRASEGQINLSWSDTTSDESGFKIERCEVASCTYAQIATVAENITSYSDTVALNIDTAYSYQMRAYKTATNGWDGPYSDPAQATTTLNTTSGLAAIPANTTTIGLSWIDKTGTETGFKIERCTADSCSDFTEVGQTVSNTTTWNDTGVCNNTTYTYRVSAMNTGLSMNGGGVWSRRMPLAITNFLPNFQTKVTIAYDSDMQADFDDIRFYDETAKREIPYYLESKIDSSTATVWIKTGDNNAISLYYGSAAALNASNGASVFELFDDFDSLAAWTLTNSFVTASGGIATVDSNGSETALYRNFDIPYPYIAESRYQFQTANAFRNRVLITTSDGTRSPTVDYGLFDNGVPQLYWGAWTGIGLSINTWYNLQWEVTDSDYSFRVFTEDGTQLVTKSAGATFADLKRAYFYGGESPSSDFMLDWFRIRKSAATLPVAALGEEESSTGYTFDKIWAGLTSATATTTTPAPTKPLNPSATRVSEARIDITWEDTTTDETGFRIERCKGVDCTGFSEIGTVGQGVTTFSDTTPMDVDSTYRYQIQAYKTATCSGGWNGPYSSIVWKESTLAAPTGLSATASVSTTCEDLRFTESDGTTLLNYWVESGCGTPFTKIWLKMPTLPAGPRPLYLYWVNPIAPAVSSPTSTFDFYDDFSGTAIDTNIWTITDGTGFSVSNGFLHGTDTTGRLTSKSLFSSGVVLEIKAKTTSIAPNGQMIGGFYLSPFNNIGWLNYPGAAHYRNDGSWVSKGDQTPANNLLYTLTVKDSSTAKLQIYNLDTSAMYWDTGDLANSVADEPIVLGTRFDDSLSVQGYSTDWDWIRTRKHASPVPAFSVGGLETGTYSLTGGTWHTRRPITVTNGGAELAGYQQELTIDTTAVASDRITLSWTDNTSSETGFIVERCTGIDCNFSTITTLNTVANATLLVDKSVALATTYCYRVKAEKSGVWTSAPSNTSCATTSTIAAPTLSAVTTTTNALSWDDATTGEDGFQVERCEGESCNFSTIDNGFPVVLGPNVTAYTDASVCSPFYRYRVKSFKYGPSGWDNIYSNIVDANTQLPLAPSEFSATRISELQINLAWTDNTTDETGFMVERCEGTGCSSFSQIAVLAPNTTAFNDFNRVPNTTYIYRVSAYKSGGCGWDNVYSGESEAASSVTAPSGLTAVAPFSTRVALAWADNTITETAFKIERCETASCSYAPLATVGTNVNSYTDDAVCSETGYSYRMKAVNEGSTNGGNGTWTRRKLITFDNFQPNFLVKVTVTYDLLMKPNFDDIRFVDSTGKELPYWIESKTNSSMANVWIKTGANSSGVYIYFGNESATSSSSLISVFGPGLMAYYPFNEADGTISGTTADSSGTGNNLNLTNFASGFGVVTGGVYGNALSLNGSNNYAELATPTVPTGSVATIEAWIYPKAYPDATYNGIVSWSTRGCSTGLALSIQNTGRLSMPTWCNDFVPASGPTATLNAWNHVVAVLDGTSATLYTNGQLVGTFTLTSLPDLSSVNLAIGELDWPTGRYFNGMIDEVRIYNRALTAEEITGRYAANLPTATFGENETVSTSNTYAWTYSTPYSTPADVTTPALVVPTDFTATRVDESQINLTWTDGVAGETAFEIDRCVGAGCDFNTRTTVEVAANTINYKDVGLLYDTTYRYRIRSKRLATCTAYSSYATAEAVTTLLAPGNLVVTSPSTTQLNLSWTDRTGSDTGFMVERCSGEGCSDFGKIGVTGPSINTYVDTSVCPSTTYRYQVKALNGGLSNDGDGCWTRRKPVTITNFQPDFQTRVTVAYENGMKADFSDIRFLDPVSNQELSYWIETKSDGETATVWVKTSVSSIIYLYYGNATATDVSSGPRTFDLFEEFTGTTLDTSKWTQVGPYFTQNDALISSGGSENWDSGMYSVANFNRPFVFEASHYHTGGNYLMIGAKDTSPNVAYNYFTHAAYAIYDGGGNRLAVYEDGNGRGDSLKPISTGIWQYYKLEVLPTGAIFSHGESNTAYTTFYTSAYSNASPLKIGFANYNQAFKFDNARVRRYANPEPTASFGSEEQSACFEFAGTYVSGYSNIASNTTQTPAAPTTVTATATTDNNINLTWSDLSNDETIFRIERCTGADCSSFDQITTVAANTVNFSDTVQPSTDYCYRVRADKTATCTTGWPTAYSNTSCAKTFPAQTATFSATAVGPFEIRLDWSDSASDETGYEIDVMVWNGKWVNIAATLSNVTTYLDRAGIEPLKTYTYRIRPFRGSDKSPFVTSNSATTPAFTQGAGTCP